MALIPIIYDPADSHQGDTLRGAMIKITDNFAYLLGLINDAPTGAEFDDAIADIEVSLANLLALINTKSPIGHKHPISDINGLQAALDTKVGTSTFNNTIDNINQTIALLNQQIADIYVDLDDAPSDGKIYGRLNATWKDISVELAIPEINAYAYQLQLQIIALQDEINDLDVSGLQADIVALSGVSGLHTSQIATLSGNVSTLVTDISDLEAEQIIQNNNIGALSGTVGTHTTQIATLSGSVATLQTTKQNNITLTTNSGATATFVGDILNIPPALGPAESATPQFNFTGATATLDNIHNNSIIKIKSNITVTIPSTLMTNFNCVFRTFAGFTVTFVAGGGVTMDAPKGLKLTEYKMATLFRDGALSVFVLEGELSV